RAPPGCHYMRMGNLLRGVIVASLLGGTASADISMEQRGPNSLAVTVDEPIPPTESLALFAERGPSARLLSVTPYAQGTEPMAVVFVMSGQEIWTGNDGFETDPNI